MPPNRLARPSRKAKQGEAPPLPRITDPYAPPYDWGDYPAILEDRTCGEQVEREAEGDIPAAGQGKPTAFQMQQERGRILLNAKVCKLRKRYERTKAANASVENASDRADANWDDWHYKRLYGKFVPDGENAAWFARKTPRIAELMILRARAAAAAGDRHDDPDMIIYLDAAKLFETDFGHHFSCDDGLNCYFNCMAYTTLMAAALASECNHDAEAIAAVASEPVSFDVINPYPVGDERRDWFDTKMRGITLALHRPGELPLDVNEIFAFCLANGYAGQGELELREHYRLLYIKHLIRVLESNHSDTYGDLVEEKREFPRSSWIEQPPLW
ncbi:hypothetical protein DFH09DRAFT_1453522 [Mycena vulgaris]|nr:hypothetical protein DFH09DRAFT_1453522 [Mycena vulgaris]